MGDSDSLQAGKPSLCNQPPRSTQPAIPTWVRVMIIKATVTVVVNEEDGEFCVVGPVVRTAGILNELVEGTGC